MSYHTVPSTTLLDYMMENLEKQAKGKRQKKAAEEIKEEYDKLIKFVKDLTNDVNKQQSSSHDDAEDPVYPDVESWGYYNGTD